MILLRSIVFNVLLWIVSIFFIIFCLPSVFLPKSVLFAPQMWARTSLWLFRWCVGTTYRVEGKENLPQGSFIIASKHQSAWETMAFNHIFPKTSFVLKKELLHFFPLNFYMTHAQMIPLDRQGSTGLKAMIQKAKNVLDQKRPLVIFPEGTRTAVGHTAPYKRGIYILYKHLQCPVVPVALNSGVYWKRREFKKRSGIIVVKILEPIQPGLDQETFMKKLESLIETHSKLLLPQESSS